MLGNGAKKIQVCRCRSWYRSWRLEAGCQIKTSFKSRLAAGQVPRQASIRESTTLNEKVYNNTHNLSPCFFFTYLPQKGSRGTFSKSSLFFNFLLTSLTKRSIILMNCFFHHKPLLFGVFRTISRGFFHNLHVFFDFVFDLKAFRLIIISTAKGRSVRNAREWCEENPA